MEYLMYLNIILFIVIIINIIILSSKSSYIERFYISSSNISPTSSNIPNINPNKIRVELRPCTINLTSDDDICNQLSDIYEMSKIQIQVLLNTMKKNNADLSSYNLLKYIRDNKDSIPINTCKIEIDNWKEIKNTYMSSNIYPYKNIINNTDYNDETLSGYCLYDVSTNSNINPDKKIINNIEDINYPNELKLYELYKFDNNVPVNTIAKLACENKNTSYLIIDNNLIFMRLNCYLDNETNLKTNNIEFVKYNSSTKKFDKIKGNLSKFLKFKYKKQIILGFDNIQVSAYVFTFDICNNIKKYVISNYINFSFDEFPEVLPVLIENNIDLPEQSDYSIYSLINMKINKIIDSYKKLNDQIQIYTENMNDIMTNYKVIEGKYINSGSSSMSSSDDDQMQYLLSKYEIIASEKTQLENELAKQKNIHLFYMNVNKKLKNATITLDEINYMIKNGCQLSYNKYSKLISNDNYIYLQV